MAAFGPDVLSAGVPSYGSGVGPTPLQTMGNVNMGASFQRDLNRIDMKYFLARRALINSYLEHRTQQESFLLGKGDCGGRPGSGAQTPMDLSIESIIRGVEGVPDDSSDSSDSSDSDTSSAASSEAKVVVKGDSEMAADSYERPSKSRKSHRSRRSRRSRGSRGSSRRARGHRGSYSVKYPVLNIQSLLRNPFHFMLLNQIDNALADQLIWLRNRHLREVQNKVGPELGVNL